MTPCVHVRLARARLGEPGVYQSVGEERWATLGLADNGQYLVVIHTFEQTGPNEATIRIISAREAERAEIKDYQDTPR